MFVVSLQNLSLHGLKYFFFILQYIRLCVITYDTQLMTHKFFVWVWRMHGDARTQMHKFVLVIWRIVSGKLRKVSPVHRKQTSKAGCDFRKANIIWTTYAPVGSVAQSETVPVTSFEKRFSCRFRRIFDLKIDKFETSDIGETPAPARRKLIDSETKNPSKTTWNGDIKIMSPGKFCSVWGNPTTTPRS